MHRVCFCMNRLIGMRSKFKTVELNQIKNKTIRKLFRNFDSIKKVGIIVYFRITHTSSL